MVGFLRYFLYSLLTWLLLPVSGLRLLWRARKAPAYRLRWQERLGWYRGSARAEARECVVFHAVSVGEVHAAQPLIELFMLAHPDLAVVLTTSTPTGSARVSSLFGDRVEHVYLPWDLPGATKRFIARFQPQMLVLLETELWPNLLLACQQSGCKVVLANARLSEKSLRGYQRFAGLSNSMLQALSLVAAQSEADGSRLVELGLHPELLVINGSLKFDVAINQEQLDRARHMKTAWQGRPVWIAASTRDGEDLPVLQAFLSLLQHLPQALLILVPRHPERFMLAGKQALAQGLKVQYFSHGNDVAADTQVLLGDTMGEMVLYYTLADVAFVGGSLVPTGCQNIIEPAALGLPVLTGPSLFNFQKVSELLCAAGGMQVISSPQELAVSLERLLTDVNLQVSMGAKAKQEVLQNQGSAVRLNRLLDDLLLQS